MSAAARLSRLRTYDLRFPTSRELDGSDAMNVDPDYSAAYVIINADDGGPEGHGFAFTIGRGNDVLISGIQAYQELFIGLSVEETLADMGGLWRRLVHDSQLRWLGPEKGVIHMAAGAIVNALWDMKAKRAGKPLWRLLAELSPQEIVDLVDFRYLTDVLTPRAALELLEERFEGRERRVGTLLQEGYPAYTTGPGWLGYDDEKLVAKCHEAVSAGFELIKLKVGADLEDDRRRLRLAREAVGEHIALAVDANQRWDVAEAVAWIEALAPFDPHWIEEPTSPDDVLGHAAIRARVSPVAIATGEHAANRVVFKQLLQQEAIDYLQLDATRVAGINENIAILLLAARFDVPVCPHAGGVGLCEQVQHLSMFDYIAVSGAREGRVIEYVDHLHEHFVDPVEIVRGAYKAPSVPGGSAQLREDCFPRFAFPDGSAWSQAHAEPTLTK